VDEPGVDVVVGFSVVDVVDVDVVEVDVVEVDVVVVGGASQPDTQNTLCFTSAP
jgi:hypothetical protein